MTQNNTDATAQMEKTNDDNDCRIRSGDINLVSVQDDMAESVGRGRRSTEILGGSGPNSAAGTSKSTNLPPRSKGVELIQKRSGVPPIQAAITVKVEKSEELGGKTVKRKKETSQG